MIACFEIFFEALNDKEKGKVAIYNVRVVGKF